MNFLDTYGITGTGSTTPSERQPEQSLNEEVSQVIGQLGRFWGGFRKQSETALASARRDLGEVVTQAQREIEKLAITETRSNPSEANEPASEDDDDESESDAEASAGTPIADNDHTPPASDDATSSAPTTAQSFFARLQSSIPPNIVSAVQVQLPDSIKHAQHFDFAQLGSTLSAEFHRVQGVTRAQAGEYVHKSEALLREAMREAGDVFRDAVKVIPPEEGAGDVPVVWDGADIWMLPGLAAADAAAAGKGKGKGKEVVVDGPAAGRVSEDVRRVATRAELLLKQLRSNPEIIRVDPAVDTSREAYMAWADGSEASGQGFGSKAWGEGIAEALGDPLDGATLQATLDALVPSIMPEEVFWVRYFFRVHQIGVEESRRKALLQATAENEDDFSWGDDEDESVSAGDAKETARTLGSSQRTLVPPRTTSTSDVISLPSSHAQSPRESSEGSYHVVPENASSTGAAETEDEEDEDEEDEDEEGEEDEEEEGEEEEEEGEGEEGEDSDWE